MFDLSGKTFMQKVMKNECDIFKKEYQNTMAQDAINSDFLDGNVLYRAMIHKEGVQELFGDLRYITTSRGMYGLNCIENPVEFIRGDNGTLTDYGSRDLAKTLFKNVTKNIIQENTNANWKECIKQIEQYRRLVGDNFYGALLRSTTNPDIIINPYHILTALSLIDADAIGSHSIAGDTFNIIVYLYDDRELMDLTYDSMYVDKEKVDGNILSIMSTYIDKIDTEYKVENMSSISTEGNCSVDYRVKKTSNEDPDTEHLMVAHQVVTRGIIAPFYGTSIISMDVTDVKGFHISPFRSANIANNDSSNGLRPEITSNNVCTGDLNKRTFTGLRSLTHSNLSSPYSTDIIGTGALIYADEMIQTSVNMFIEAGIKLESTDDSEGTSDE